MKSQQDYTQDVTEIRAMMERATKFLSLTGWSGIMAGVYGLAGAWLAYRLMNGVGGRIVYQSVASYNKSGITLQLILVASAVLALAIGTGIVLSAKKAGKTGAILWNMAARRMVANMLIPLAAGGMFILILFSRGLLELILPATLIFYGFALYNAGKFTFGEIRYLGVIEMALGLLATYYIEYGLLFWAFGFGILHILYGIYLHIKYD